MTPRGRGVNNPAPADPAGIDILISLGTSMINSMKVLPLLRGLPSGRVTVQCADGEVVVHSHCAYCTHCSGIRVGKRSMPNPILQAYKDVRRGTAPDEALMNAAMMFNTLIRDGDAIDCDDDGNEGFSSLYHHC